MHCVCRLLAESTRGSGGAATQSRVDPPVGSTRGQVGQGHGRRVDRLESRLAADNGRVPQRVDHVRGRFTACARRARDRGRVDCWRGRVERRGLQQTVSRRSAESTRAGLATARARRVDYRGRSTCAGWQRTRVDYLRSRHTRASQPRALGAVNDYRGDRQAPVGSGRELTVCGVDTRNGLGRAAGRELTVCGVDTRGLR